MLDHYSAFWRKGIPVDIVDMSCDFSRYKLVIAPMLYLQREDIVEKLRAFVENGGTLIGTYWSGLVNENDLCFQGFAPNGLKDVFGLYAEEIDALWPDQKNHLVLPCGTRYEISDYCEIVHPDTAEVLAAYGEDFYAGCPVLTKNRFGRGQAYYLAGRAGRDFFLDFYGNLAKDLALTPALGETVLPHNVTAGLRKNDTDAYVIVQNYNAEAVNFPLAGSYREFESGAHS